MADALVLEMQALVRGAAEPWRPGDSIKAGIGRASRNLGLPFRRTRTLWYGQRCRVLAVEADQVRARSRALLTERQRRLDAELEAVKARLAALADQP